MAVVEWVLLVLRPSLRPEATWAPEAEPSEVRQTWLPLGPKVLALRDPVVGRTEPFWSAVRWLSVGSVAGAYPLVRGTRLAA